MPKLFLREPLLSSRACARFPRGRARFRLRYSKDRASAFRVAHCLEPGYSTLFRIVSDNPGRVDFVTLDVEPLLYLGDTTVLFLPGIRWNRYAEQYEVCCVSAYFRSAGLVQIANMHASYSVEVRCRPPKKLMRLGVER